MGDPEASSEYLDVVGAASEVVDRCLTYIEIKSEVQQLLTDRASKFTCRCLSCRSDLERTADWLREMGREAA